MAQLACLIARKSIRIAPFVEGSVTTRDEEQNQTNVMIDDVGKDIQCKPGVYDCQAEQIRLEEAFCLPVPLLLMLLFEAQRQRCFPRSV